MAAVLSFSSILNNDKVGVILFSDRVEKFIPPQKGRKHILRIIREIIELKPQSNKTNIAEALRYLTNAVKKRCTAFVLSDFNACEREHLKTLIEHVKKSIKALLSNDMKEVALHYSLKQTLCQENKQ